MVSTYRHRITTIIKNLRKKWYHTCIPEEKKKLQTYLQKKSVCVWEREISNDSAKKKKKKENTLELG